MTTTATTEPTELRAGDSWRWVKDLSADYPASAWALTYRFTNATAAFEIVAGTDGSQFDVVAAPAVTAAYGAGDYNWASRVTQSTTAAYSIGSGVLSVLPDLFAGTATASDQRTHAQKVLDAVESLIEGRATSDASSYSIAGRSITKMSVDELIQWRAHYRREVARQQGRSDRVYARFTNA